MMIGPGRSGQTTSSKGHASGDKILYKIAAPVIVILQASELVMWTKHLVLNYTNADTAIVIPSNRL